MSKATTSQKRSGQKVYNGSPSKSLLKIPLNDDAQEKAERLQSRQALHDIQFSQIKAAASPIRKQTNFEGAAGSSPTSNTKTPRRIGKENDLDAGHFVVGGNAITPMKRVPILANFEEWMKMATDNKINAANSWNFALIDYFHDLSLLKEGDGVNFQKASCTLDGCVKIYTSRVDSVATETGKLLSGLADSSTNKTPKNDNEDVDNGEEEIEDEDGVVQKRPKKRTQRSSDVTLASSFEALRLKKFELEFSVDPLFKKASADFDEGGAKGLLLNHLSIDGQGRIVFDSSDDNLDVLNEIQTTAEQDESPDQNDKLDSSSNKKAATIIQDVDESTEISITSLGSRFFPNLESIEEQDICPSLKNFDLGDTSDNFNTIPFLKVPEDWRLDKEKSDVNGEKGNSVLPSHDNQIRLDDDDDDDDDGLLGNFELPDNTGFGEGGDAWAHDACQETRARVITAGLESNDFGESADADDVNVGSSSEFATHLHTSNKIHANHNDILSYFDETLQKNWAGPEHWRIQRIKDSDKVPLVLKTKKEKELFKIDFTSPMSASSIEAIYIQATSNSAISLPKKERKTKNKNLLPDDKHFNSNQLLGLFLKPNTYLGCQRSGFSHKPLILNQKRDFNPSDGLVNEALWDKEKEEVKPDDTVVQGNYDANFFQDNEMTTTDDLDDDIEYPDVQDHLPPNIEEKGEVVGNLAIHIHDGPIHSSSDAFGNQLVTSNRRSRPEYVQYARVAKRVDVRRLKEEIWKGIGFDNNKPQNAHSRLLTPDAEDEKGTLRSLKFTTIMQNLREVYPKQVMNDISTSYCFICLLHLANEKGLMINNQEGLIDLEISKDTSVETVAVS